MQCIFRPSRSSAPYPPCVLTFGKFDGVHRGHQALLQQLHALATQTDLPAAVLIFEPQPAEILAPHQAPERLTSLRDKIYALSAYPIDYLYCIRFTRNLASQPAEAFVRQILFRQLQAQHILVGSDARFGHARAGDVKLLHQLAMAQNRQVHLFSEHHHHMQRVSSTLIRQCLKGDDLDLAAQLLGRPYTVLGRVIYGQGLGRQLGFPTANLHVRYARPLLQGVYAVRCTTQQGFMLQGVANWGVRPTCGKGKPTLEVHLFDFNGQLNGQFLEVTFLKKLRSEKRFPSFDQLTQQIQQDAAQAREVFKAL